GRLLRVFPATALFYLTSAVLAAATGAAWFYAASGGYGYLVPVAAGVAAVALLLYARMLGRLAWLVAQFGPLGPTPGEPAASPPPPKRKGKRPKAAVTDPWAAPEEEAPKEVMWQGEPVGSYGLSGEADAAPPPLDLLSGRLPDTEREIEEER